MGFLGLKVCTLELIYSSFWTCINHMSCILKNLLSSNLSCKILKIIPLHIFVDQYKTYYYVHLPTMKHWKQIVLFVIFLPLSTLNSIEGSTCFQHLFLYKELNLMSLPIQMVLFQVLKCRGQLNCKLYSTLPSHVSLLTRANLRLNLVFVLGELKSFKV